MSAFASDRRFARRYAETLRQAGIDTGRDRVRALGDTLVAGTAAIDADDNEKAREMFTTLLGEDGSTHVARQGGDWRGYLAALDGRLDEALPDFDTAVELETRPSTGSIAAARSRAAAGTRMRSPTWTAQSLSTPRTRSRSSSSRPHQVAGRLDKAAADVGRAVELQPKNTVAWLLQADVLQLTGKPKRRSPAPTGR